MDKVTRKLWVPDGIKLISEKERTISHVITSKTVDRDSEVVMPRGCRDKDFRKNPVVFLNHKSWSEPPIGRNVSLEITEQEVFAITQFAGLEQMHPQAEMLFRLYRDGFMKAWSVGFYAIGITKDPIMPGQKGHTITDWDLMEYSAVGIPANPDALCRMAKSFGLPDGATDKDLAEAIGILEPKKFWEVGAEILKAPEPETRREPVIEEEKKEGTIEVHLDMSKVEEKLDSLVARLTSVDEKLASVLEKAEKIENLEQKSTEVQPEQKEETKADETADPKSLVDALLAEINSTLNKQ